MRFDGIVYVHDQTEILHLHTTAGDIDTTTNHPFYVIGKGWVAAGDINEGDEVFLIDGSTAVVTGAELEKLEEPIKVYNLEVEDYNTFFVGDEAVLVHNYETEYDLYAAGRNGGNPSGRSKDFGLKADAPGSTIIDGNMKPSGNNSEFGGASSFETLEELRSKLNNPKAFKLPSGTTLPEGLGLKQDIPGGHNTLYPTIQMTLENFYSLVRNLPWILIGR